MTVALTMLGAALVLAIILFAIIGLAFVLACWRWVVRG